MDYASELNEFYTAEKYYTDKMYDEAKTIYTDLVSGASDISALSTLRLGEIANINGEPVLARKLMLEAYEAFPMLASRIVKLEHASYPYIYLGIVDETEVKACPLCGREGSPYWSYNMVEYIDFNVEFNPIRTWMYCDTCHHLYASAYPLTPSAKESENSTFHVLPSLFSIYSELLNRLKQIAGGNRLLEIGIGGGELIAIAKEMLFDGVGIDISLGNVERARQMFHVEVDCVDFFDYNPNQQFNIVCMGDVLEHMADPRRAIQKVSEMLTENGVLWVSTPNFEGAYSLYAGHNDPMKRVPGHLNYYSDKSLRLLLETEGYELIHYDISKHYNGSMEIIARKK